MASRPIDERIVIMRLENDQFKARAAETVTLFGKLKQAIGNVGNSRLDKVSNDISNIEKSANRFSLQGMVSAVDTISSRFSTLGVVATTTLMNITNKAVDAGMALAKNLTVDQVSDGFREYETKIGSIGTVLSNTEWAGTTLDDVKRVLEELNVYADNTVYSFGQMTENIGRFTAAGVGIEDSATAIKGLSNLAAASGSDVNQLNTAMYQMSQSMAAGTFNLMDWNSLVNAGMGGKKTQDALLETAKAMGVNVDMSEGFRNSISKGWLSAEVFLETMKKFGNDESMTEAATAVRTFTGMMDSLKEGIGSGWATTWEIIFGDFEQATKFWTALSNSVTGFFGESSKSRNDMLQNLVNSGALEDFGLGIRNVLIPISQLFKAVGDGFKRAFPPTTTAQLKSMTEGFKNFTSGLKMSDETLGKVTTVFQGVFSVLSSGIEIVKRVGSALFNLVPKGVGGGLLDILVRFAEFSIALNQSLKDGNAFTNWIDGLGSVLGAISSALGPVIVALLNFSGSVLGNVGEAIDWIVKKLAPLGQILKDAFGGVDGADILGVGMVAGIMILVKKLTGAFDNLTDLFDNISDIFSNAGGMFESLGETLNAFATGIKIANLVMISGALMLIAISLKMLEGIETQDLARGIIALGVSLALMMGALAVISKFNLVGGIKASATLVALALAVTIMAASLKSISSINPEELKTGISGLVVIVGTLVTAIVALSKLGGKIATSSVSLIALATAVYILAEAVDGLSGIETKDLKKSVVALGLIFAELALFLKVVNGVKLSVTSAVAVIAIAAALQIMVDAVQKISNLDVATLTKGLITIGILLAEIALFSFVAGGPQMLLAGTGIMLIAGALNMLVPSIQTLGGMTWEELVKGLGGIALALVAVAGAGILATGAIGGAVAITVMAAALNVLVGPIERFASLTWGEIIKGLSSVALALGLLAAAAILMTPVIPSLLGLGIALTTVGAAMVLAGAGIALFGVGLTTLATMTLASVASIVAGLGLMLKGFAELIPAAVDFIVKLGSSLLDGITTLVPKLLNAVVAVVMAILNVLDTNLPQFITVGISIIVKIIEGIEEALPQLITKALELIVTLIETLAQAIRDNGPMILSALWELVASILILLIEAGGQVINSLFGWIPGVTDAVSSVGTAAEEYLMASFGADVIGTNKGVDFASSLAGTSGDAASAGELIATAGKDGAEGIEMETTGSNFGTGFINGISSMADSAYNAAKSLATSAMSAITNTLDINSPSKVTHALGENTGQGFTGGITSQGKSVAEAVFGWLPGMQASTDKINKQASSSGEKIGHSAVSSIGKGIEKSKSKTTKKAKKTAKDIAAEASKAFKDKMDDAEYRFEIGKTDSNQYIADIEKIKKAYSKYPKLVQEAELEIQDIRKKSHEDQMKNLENQYELGEITSDQYIKKLKEMEKVYAKKPLEAQKVQLKVKKVEEDAAKAREDIANKEFELYKTQISEKKDYNELSLADELKAWQDIQAKYAEGTTFRKEADKEVYRLKNEINTKLISINEEYGTKIEELHNKEIESIKNVNAEYDTALNDRTNKLTNFAGIFDEVTAKEDVSGAKLLANLKTQFTTLEQWTKDISKLAGRGIDEALLGTLTEMGPSAATEIQALNTLTDSQLTEYVEVWRKKNELAKTQATSELAGLRAETDKKILEIRTDSAKQLEVYKNEWVRKITEIKQGTKDQFVGLHSDMNVIAQNAMEGLRIGLDNKKGDVLATAKAIADEIAAVINAALDVNSPSKVTMASGESVGEGLVVGMVNSIKSVVGGAKKLAVSATDTINGLLNGVDIGHLDNTIHIKAVLEYDKESLDHLNRGLGVKPDLSYTLQSAQSLPTSKRQNDDNVPRVVRTDGEGVKEVNFEQNLHFHTKEMSPSEVARKNKQASRELVAKLS